MKKLITIMALILVGCHKEETPTPDPIDTVSRATLINNILYVGRWNSSHTYSGWGGAYIKFRFTDKATITFSDVSTNYYYTIVDGGAAVKHVVSNPSSITVNDSGNHELIVAQGKDYHYGFNLVSVQGNISPATTGKLAEFIGDSITAGYFDTKADVSDYAWIVSEMLNVEHTQIAYPGIKLVNGMDEQYGKSSCTGSSDWNFSYTPDVVVINLGTNDQNKGVSDDVFKASYWNFLKEIRGKYPNAEILALRPFNGAKWGSIKSAVQMRKNAGDKKVDEIDSSGWLTSGDFVDGLHPNDSGQVKVANKLKPILQQYL